MKSRLPVLNGRVAESSIRTDGTRKRIVTADVHGPYTFARQIAFVTLIVLWVLLPWIHIHGEPAVFLDIGRRQFFLFGATFNAQDLWLLFFVLTGLAFGLLFVTALVGRVWCGWACPQTVFLEGVFRRIERLILGSRETRARRDKHGASFASTWRTILAHTLYVLASIAIAHVFVAYFVSIPQLFAMVRLAPTDHLEVFVWMLAVSAIFYGNFVFFREQTCLVLCPYGRLQSMLLDEDSLVIGYDEIRGEPRGKRGHTTGDCVDCNRCVVVCPTGIDIRNGLQMDCIGCSACIDACDDVMQKLERPKGLIRYDSIRGLRREPRQILRPRVVFYGLFLVVGAIVTLFAARARTPFEATLVRLAGPPFTREDGKIRNAFEVRLVNKSGNPETFEIEAEPVSNETFTIPIEHVTLDALASQRIPVFVTARGDLVGKPAVRIRVRRQDGATHLAEGTFLGGAP